MSKVIALSEVKQLKSQFLEMIAVGYIETLALNELAIPRGSFIRWCTEDTEFIKQIEEARRSRAEFWVSKIAHNIDVLPDAKDVAAEKYRLEKLMFLAKADNPDRYGNNNKSKIDISIDLKQFKLLPPDEAVKALALDPFAIVEAEYTNVGIKDNNTDISIDTLSGTITDTIVLLVPDEELL